MGDHQRTERTPERRRGWDQICEGLAAPQYMGLEAMPQEFKIIMSKSVYFVHCRMVTNDNIRLLFSKFPEEKEEEEEEFIFHKEQ